MPRRQVFFGWRVVGAAFVVAVFAWGAGFYGPSVFLRTFHDERNWSVAVVSAAISAHFLISAGLVAYLSEAHRRFGIVGVTRAGAVALAGGMLAWALTDEPWQLFAAALLSGAGWAAISAAAINAMVAPCTTSERRRHRSAWQWTAKGHRPPHRESGRVGANRSRGRPYCATGGSS